MNSDKKYTFLYKSQFAYIQDYTVSVFCYNFQRAQVKARQLIQVDLQYPFDIKNLVLICVEEVK